MTQATQETPMTTTANKVQIVAPKVPGQQPSVIAGFADVRSARAEAKNRFARRRDLKRHDVRIELIATGKLVEYAGPQR